MASRFQVLFLKAGQVCPRKRTETKSSTAGFKPRAWVLMKWGHTLNVCRFIYLDEFIHE